MASATSTFDDPAENPISEGAVWDSGPGTWFAAQKTGGVCKQAPSGVDELWAARRNSPTIGDAQYSEVNITVAGFAGPMTRIQGTGAGAGDCYVLEDNGGTSELKFYRVDDTGSLTYTQIGAAFSITPSLPDDMRVESDGSTHTIKFNGSSLGTRSDATYSGGQPGLGGYGATPNFTSWGGGDLAAGGGTPYHPWQHRGPILAH